MKRAWPAGASTESPQLPERFDTSIRGMVRRDRNHPSVVMWGLLNENMGDAAFYYAVSRLPFVRPLDDTPGGDAQQRAV